MMYCRLKGEEEWNEVTKLGIKFMIEDYRVVDVLHDMLDWEYIDIADYLEEHLGMTTRAFQNEVVDYIFDNADLVQKVYGDNYEINTEDK